MGGLAAPAELNRPVADAGPALGQQAGVQTEVHQAGLAAEAVVAVDLQLAGLPGWGELVLGHLDLDAGAEELVLLGHGFGQAQVQADRGVVAEGAPTGGVERLAGGAGALAELVGRHYRGVGPVDRAGELPKGLAEQVGLHPGVVLADLAVQLGLGDEGGDRVDDHHRHLAGADQEAGDLEGLLAAGGLADQELMGVDADLLGPVEVEGVLGVDEQPGPASALGLGEDGEGESGLADAFGAVDLGDTALGEAADTEGVVEGQAAGGDHCWRGGGGAVRGGDDRRAELLDDAVQGGFQAAALLVGGVWSDGARGGHASSFP
jgi:hypothetical protein